MRTTRRGSALASALMACSVLVILLFTMAEAATFHLQFATATENRAQASDLAESVVNQALSEVLLDDSYGTAVKPTIRIDGQGDVNRNYGLLSFQSGSGVPHSTNSLAVTAQVTGSTGHAVPANTIHLVGQGHVGDQVRTVEAIYYRPPFPKALSASGPIHAKGTIVTAIKPDATYPGSPGSIPAGQRLPGSLQSNSTLTGSQNALELSDCDISGDVAAVGQVAVGANNTIGGEVRSHGSAQPIPHLNIEDRIASIQNADGTEILGGSIGDKTVDWFAGSPAGPLTINGDLILNNGVLWVKGDLTITGGIKGQGLILATGKVEVQKGTQLNAQNLVAVACNGDAVFVGSGQNSYYFQGLVYTKGNFVARNLTVLGAVIADGDVPTAGGLDLQNVNFIQSPAAASLRAGQLLAAQGSPSGTGILTGPAQIPPSISGIPAYMTMTPEPISSATLPPGQRPSLYNLTLFYNNRTLNYTGSSEQITAFIRYLSNNKPSKNLSIMNSGPTPHPPPPGATTNWLSPLKKNNDFEQQLDAEFDEIAKNELQRQLLPSINNLMPLGDRSRMLLYRAY